MIYKHFGHESKYSLQNTKLLNARNPFHLLNSQQPVIDYVQRKLVLAQREENKYLQ
jgi:hypothetical protein